MRDVPAVNRYFGDVSRPKTCMSNTDVCSNKLGMKLVVGEKLRKRVEKENSVKDAID